MLRRLLLLNLSLALAAPAYAAPADPNCVVPASTFELIQSGIFDRHDCTMSYCHGADRQAGLDLRAGNAYANLLHGATDPDPAAAATDINLVEPGRPDDSLLWLALARKTLRRPSGPHVQIPAMPRDGLPLSGDELEGVRLWILAGAPETGVVDGVADLIDPCPQPVAEDIAALPTCQADDPSLLLPNLVADPPEEVRVYTRAGHRRVEFATNVGNTGDGPLILQAGELPAAPGHTVDAMQVILRTDGSKCVHRAGTMRLSDSGERWSYGNFADFELRRDDPLTGEVVASSSKPAFCLVDSEPLRGAENNPHQYELHCTDPIGRMGISVGYKDVYSRVVPTQWIDLDADPGKTIEPGTYYLVNIADPSNHLWEKDDLREDNANYRVLRLGLRDPDEPQARRTPVRLNPTPTPTSVPTLQPTPRRRPVPRPVRTTRRNQPAHRQRTPGAAQPEHPVPPVHPAHPRSPHQQPSH